MTFCRPFAVLLEKKFKLPWKLTAWTQPGFPGGSDSKESARIVGDLGSIPELGRSPEEGNSYPLQYSWASLVAQLVKNPPAQMWETWVQFLGWENPLKKGTATHSSILAWRIPWTIQWQWVGHGWVTFTFTLEKLGIMEGHAKPPFGIVTFLFLNILFCIAV